MNESTSWAGFKEAIRAEAAARLHAVHIVRVESLIGAGIFDCCLCYRGVTVWMEGKYLPKFPLRRGTSVKVGFSDYQELFATRRLLAGGISFLWVHVGFNTLDGSQLSDATRKDRGKLNKVQEGSSTVESVGRGWYLVELCSVDLIHMAKVGFRQGFLGEMVVATPRTLAVRLLDKLELMGNFR